MTDKKRNNWRSKIKRTFTSTLLPVAKNRKGKCQNCGECCKLPKMCGFLKFKKNGESFCSIYPIRPPNCRKYPLNEFEFITEDTCGYRFRSLLG